VDTTAAGDTFTGFFLAGAAQGLHVETLLENASKASSIAITRPGAAQSIPTMEEVKTTEMVLVNYFR
jgi:ribokinase